MKIGSNSEIDAFWKVLTGRADFYFSPPPPASSFIRDGKRKPLAITSSRRSSVLPEAPTTIENGFPNSNYEFWVGAFALSKTPKAIVEVLTRELRTALETTAVREKFAAMGTDPIPISPQEFDAHRRATSKTPSNKRRIAMIMHESAPGVFSLYARQAVGHPPRPKAQP